MKPLRNIVVQLLRLKVVSHHYDFEIDNTFFEHFEFEDFNDCNIKVDVNLEKKSTLLEFDFDVTGTVNVNCDLSNEPFDQPIKGHYHLVVKFGQEFNDDDDEILILPHGEFEINIAQYIYESVVLSVPKKLVHPGIEDGTLKSEILDKLEELSPDADDKKETDKTDPRWDTLKKLLTDK